MAVLEARLRLQRYLLGQGKKADDTAAGLFWGVLAVAIPFLVYWRTLAPTVYGLDSAELTTGAYTLGIVHAPGSPLYLLLGHLFTWLPVGDVGYRLNLMSACATAVTIFFVYHILYHLTGRRLLSLAAAWFLAFTYYVWITAVAAELYALSGLFVTGLLLLALKWRQQQQPWQLLALTFFFGLGLGNHLSLLLIAPGLAVLLLSAGHRLWQPKLLLAAAFSGLLGASIYLYLPLRYVSDTPLNYARYWGVDLTTLSGFWWMVTGRMFGPLFFGVPLSNLPDEFFTYLDRLWSNFVGLGILLGMLGLVSNFRKRPSLHITLLLMFVTHIVFYLTYRVGDKELMFLPTYLIWGVWVGIGVAYLTEWIRHRTQESPELIGAVLMLSMAIGCLVLNFRYVDLSQDWSARRLGEAILSEVKPQAVFIGTWKDVPILEYLQIVEGKRKDITIVNRFFTSAETSRHIVHQSLSAGQPAYTSVLDVIDRERVKGAYLHACQCYELVLTRP